MSFLKLEFFDYLKQLKRENKSKSKLTQNMAHFPILLEWTRENELFASFIDIELPLIELERIELGICDMLK